MVLEAGAMMKNFYPYFFLASWHPEYLNIYISIIFRVPRIGHVTKVRVPECQSARRGYWHPDSAEDSLKLLHFKAVPARSWCFRDKRGSNGQGVQLFPLENWGLTGSLASLKMPEKSKLLQINELINVE